MAQTLEQIAAGMSARMTEYLTFWGDRNHQGSTVRVNLGRGGGTLGAIHRRGLIGQGRDERGIEGYYLTPLGWALYTHLTGKPRPADPGRLSLADALAAAYNEAPAAVPLPAGVKPLDLGVTPLDQDVTVPADMFNPELTYYADGTPVLMRWAGGEATGTTAGMTTDASPYQFQTVRFEDGTVRNIAPHVLHRLDKAPAPPAPATASAPAAPRYLADYEFAVDGEQHLQRITVTPEGADTPVLETVLPYDPERNAGRALEALGWTITGMETYGGPEMFRAWVKPSPVRDTTLLLPDQARGIVSQVHTTAEDFRSVEDEAGALLGYTFRAEAAGRARYGFITLARTFSMALEPTREDAAALLPAAVLSDQRQAQRPAPALARAAALAAQRDKAAADRAAYRAAMDDRSAAEAHRHGAPLPAATVERMAERTNSGPFKPGDQVVRADGEIRRGLAALRESDRTPHENALAGRVGEGVLVRHVGVTEGCVPRDVEDPDVLAARRALAGLAAARMTDHHDVTEPIEQERDVRGYLVNPRGQGRVAIYWLEGGRIIRRDTPLHGAALDCLEDRMRREGWETERMGPSALCLFAHVPDEQRQG